MSPWIEIPGGRFVLGLLPDEVDALATASAQAAREHLERSLDAGLREEREVEAKSGNVDFLRPLVARAFSPRDVELAPFAIARAPVTNREWKHFLADAKLSPPDDWSVPGAHADERAVIGVSWDEASQYAAWAGAALPSEAHWERAARGPARRLFPWGDAWGAQGAWLDAQPYYDPWPSGAHPELASPDGVHDAITRRWEWCADAFTAADAAALGRFTRAARRRPGPARRRGRSAGCVRGRTYRHAALVARRRDGIPPRAVMAASRRPLSSRRRRKQRPPASRGLDRAGRSTAAGSAHSRRRNPRDGTQRSARRRRRRR